MKWLIFSYSKSTLLLCGNIIVVETNKFALHKAPRGSTNNLTCYKPTKGNKNQHRYPPLNQLQLLHVNKLIKECEKFLVGEPTVRKFPKLTNPISILLSNEPQLATVFK